MGQGLGLAAEAGGGMAAQVLAQVGADPFGALAEGQLKPGGSISGLGPLPGHAGEELAQGAEGLGSVAQHRSETRQPVAVEAGEAVEQLVGEVGMALQPEAAAPLGHQHIGKR